MTDNDKITEAVKNGLITASSSFREDKKKALLNAFEKERNETAGSIIKMLIENYEVADKDHCPLCDDTGIPHLILELGYNSALTPDNIDAINEGIRQGLQMLPGRPMAILGSDVQRIDQSGGLSDDPADVEPAPMIIKRGNESNSRLHILMFGGGPAIRAKTYRIFHNHSIETVINEIVEWSSEAAMKLGCTPCTLAIGIGRSHYEASSMMLMAQAEGDYSIQTELESEITKRVNESGVGVLGVGGNTTVLATFLKIGPQRASGVRIVCVRPCCCFEPRRAVVDLG